MTRQAHGHQVGIPFFTHTIIVEMVNVIGVTITPELPAFVVIALKYAASPATPFVGKKILVVTIPESGCIPTELAFDLSHSRKTTTNDIGVFAFVPRAQSVSVSEPRFYRHELEMPRERGTTVGTLKAKETRPIAFCLLARCCTRMLTRKPAREFRQKFRLVEKSTFYLHNGLSSVQEHLDHDPAFRGLLNRGNCEWLLDRCRMAHSLQGDHIALRGGTI